MDKVDSDDKKKDLGNSRAVGRMIRVSPIKLNYEAKAIRGKNVDDALSYLEFSKRRISLQVKKILESAIANAENNHSLDVDRLYIDEAYVGKNMVMKRWRPRARGRVGRLASSTTRPRGAWLAPAASPIPPQ